MSAVPSSTPRSAWSTNFPLQKSSGPTLRWMFRPISSADGCRFAAPSRVVLGRDPVRARPRVVVTRDHDRFLPITDRLQLADAVDQVGVLRRSGNELFLE